MTEDRRPVPPVTDPRGTLMYLTTSFALADLLTGDHPVVSHASALPAVDPPQGILSTLSYLSSLLISGNSGQTSCP